MGCSPLYSLACGMRCFVATAEAAFGEASRCCLDQPHRTLHAESPVVAAPRGHGKVLRKHAHVLFSAPAHTNGPWRIVLRQALPAHARRRHRTLMRFGGDVVNAGCSFTGDIHAVYLACLRGSRTSLVLCCMSPGVSCLNKVK